MMLMQKERMITDPRHSILNLMRQTIALTKL